MLRKLALVAAVALGTAIAAGAAQAQELGLTPSHVVGLWTNTNNALLTVAGLTSGDADWAKRLEAMAPERFEGKKPADVLNRVVEFRDKLDRLLQRSGQQETKRYQSGSGTVTPSVVFLNSGHVLDAVTLWIVAKTPREQLVSQYYTRHSFSGKTPSAAFGMVDLANRRIDRILANSAT